MSLKPAVLLAIALLCAAAPSSGRVIGVFDTQSGLPLEGVQVRDAFTGASVLTSFTGTAPLNFLTARNGVFIIELRKLGYQPKQVVVAAEDTASVTEVMDRLVELAPIVTTERYRIDRDAGLWSGFEQRCQSQSVTCIRADELAKKASANIADVILHARGVTLGACGGAARSGRNGLCGTIAMHSLQSPPPYCQPTFFVDGYEWNAHVDVPVDLRPGEPASAPYTPANVKAIEVYSPERARPSRFQGNPICGVVVIWTK